MIENNPLREHQRRIREKRYGVIKSILKALKHLIIIIILFSALNLFWNKYSDRIITFTRNSFNTYQLIKHCEEVQETQKQFTNSNAYPNTVEECLIIGVELN